MIYKKKPELTEAVRFMGHETPELVAFCGKSLQSNISVKKKKLTGWFLVNERSDLLEQPYTYIELVIGDYILKDTWGHFYTMKPQMFESMFEVA